MRRSRLGFIVAGLVLVAAASGAWWKLRARPDRSEEARREVGPELERALRQVGSSLGAPAFVRVFKQPATLELWVRSTERFVLFRTYPVCRVSGGLGPKTASGDLQAPEGLYALTLDQLNPRSRFYLSLNLGYPNAFEAARGWTGDALMIHGGCVSVGCYAMGDRAIAEIFTVVREALRAGQSAVPVQALPFPLTPENLTRHADSAHRAYWDTLEPAYRLFEREKLPPRITVLAGGYQIEPAASAGGNPGNDTPKGRTLELELDGDDLESDLASIDAALRPSASSADVLSIRSLRPSFGDVGLARLIERHPDLAPSRLALVSAGLTPRGLAALLESRLVSRLRVLNLQDNLLGPEGARVIAASTRLASVRELDLARNHLLEAGAVALSGARRLKNLERLELGYNFIGSAGAAALAQSSALPNLADLGLAYNFLKDAGALAVARGAGPKLTVLDLRSNEIQEPGAQALAGAKTRLYLDAGPSENRLTGLGKGGDESFEVPRQATLTVAGSVPDSLPSTVEFRELWIWEFGFVAAFPAFMTPDRAPGNGKSRTFTWLDRATLSIGGYWPVTEAWSETLASWTKPTPGDHATVERPSSRVAIVRHSTTDKVTVQRLERAHDAILYVDFSYAREFETYFAPIVEKVLGSAYFDRKHLEEAAAGK